MDCNLIYTLQGEFGIGILDGRGHIDHDLDRYRPEGLPGDDEHRRFALRGGGASGSLAEKGAEHRMSPLLEGIRTLSGEKIQWYLASELRDRIGTRRRASL